MKKIVLVLLSVMTIVFGSSFKVNENLRKEALQQEKCYLVKVTFDVVWEKRTARNYGTVVSSETKKTGATFTTRQCAYSESDAMDQAKDECYQVCNNTGKYIQQTSDGYYLFEVRKITKTEVIGSCGGC